jgi:hypothetical protein
MRVSLHWDEKCMEMRVQGLSVYAELLADTIVSEVGEEATGEEKNNHERVFKNMSDEPGDGP